MIKFFLDEDKKRKSSKQIASSDSDSDDSSSDSNDDNFDFGKKRTRRGAKKEETKQENSDQKSNNIDFEDIGSEDLQDSQSTKEENKTDDKLDKKQSLRQKLTSTLGGVNKVKNFGASLLDRGMSAVHNLKENVTHLGGSSLDKDIISGQEKKMAQKRMSEDFGQVQEVTISATKNEHHTIKSEYDQEDSKDGNNLLNEIKKNLDQDLNDTKKATDLNALIDKISSSNDDSSISNGKKHIQNNSDEDDDDEDVNLSEGAKKKLLDAMMDKDSDEDGENEDDDEDEDEDEDDHDGEGQDHSNHEGGISSKNSDSLINDDIANRSLNGDDEDQLVVQNELNYLKYVSDKFNQQTDVLEIIDKNERSFKQIAEKMIQQTSQLVQPLTHSQEEDGHGGPTAKRLMHFKSLQFISDYFHANNKNGFPYSISALEQYIAIGSSDGAVRIFDIYEREIKCLSEKSTKQVPVTSLDIIRYKGTNVYVVCGHQKGQVSLYEVKGLRGKEDQMGSVTSKHMKTVSDIHSSSVVSVKFFGEVGPNSKKISVVSCDLEGVVYLSHFRESMIGCQCNKQCFMKKRIGATFSIAPFLTSTKTLLDELNEMSPINVTEEQDPIQTSQTQLIAFGSLNQILIAQIFPQAKELLFIDRPDYIEIGTVPYLDWGYGLSPCNRDKSYPMLAIAWGKIIQLALFLNFQQNQNSVDSEPPLLHYDGFYVCDSSVDSCFFLSESILFVLVNKKEVRILYTQNFTPGLFDETYSAGDLVRTSPQKQRFTSQYDRKKYFNTLKEKFVGMVSTYAEKDKGYRLLSNDELKFKDIIGTNQPKSNFNFNPTICKNKENIILALGKTSMGYGKLLHWDEYLDLIRKTNNDDWLMVLRAALDIFNGKMIGLSGIPDHKETREKMFREEMKDLLRQNIDACIREFQEGKQIQTKTLRVALEFCIRVGEIDHLFGELFQMFAEAGMEQKYFENLEVFILSGKFKSTKIPKKILVRMIEFYRQKDPELLEKVLLNIDLTKYKNILEVRHICETEFLTSALIQILTNLFDKDNELLCSLFNMLTKSKHQKEKSDIFKLSTYDPDLQSKEGESPVKQSEEEKKGEEQINTNSKSLNKTQKFEIEQSQTYIGYKLLWVMKMFLEGKKFPAGSLSAFKWRIYVYDIVRFVTNEKFLNWFLEFDPDSFFKLLKSLFLDQEPYEYIVSQKGFIEMYKDSINGLDECMTHTQIIDALQQAVITYINKDREQRDGFLSEKAESALNAFIFFIAQIGRKPQVQIPEQLCVYVVKEHLKFYKKLLKIPNITGEVIQKLSNTNVRDKHEKKQDKITKLYLQLIKKNEKDIINLLQRCEDQLDEDEIQTLWKDAERSPMFKVKIYLMQIQRNYQQCLEMYFKLQAISEDVFQWLNEIQNQMKLQQNIEAKSQLNQLIFQSIAQLADMDPLQTIKLVETWLDNDHMKVLQRFKDQDTIFKYLSTFIAEKEPKIQEEYQKIILSNVRVNDSYYNDYKEIMLRFVRNLCEKKFRAKLPEYVKKKYFPIKEALETIHEYLTESQKTEKKSKPIDKDKDINEALAILQRRQGNFENSIDLYINVLVEISTTEIISALYVNANIKFDDQAGTTNQHILKFDRLLMDIIKICEKEGGRLPESEQENLWIHSIRAVYSIKSIVFETQTSLKEKDQQRFTIFHMIRIQEFMKRMSEHVNLRKILQFLEDIGQPIKYQEFRQTFEEKVKTELYHENILKNGMNLLLNDLNGESTVLKNLHVRHQFPLTEIFSHEECHVRKKNVTFVKGHLFIDGMFKTQYSLDVVIYSIKDVHNQITTDAVSVSTNSKKQVTIIQNQFISGLTLSQRGVRRVGKKQKDSDGNEEDKEEDVATKKKQKKIIDEEATKPRKLHDLEKEQQNSFTEQFTKIMGRFDRDLDEKIIRIENFYVY